MIYLEILNINNNYRGRWNVEIYFSRKRRMFCKSIMAVKTENSVQ